MTVQINSNYLENYSKEYAQIVCDRFFSSRQFITGQDIIQLTNSTQVNFFIIKRLFEQWQEELAKLKSNPFFDYRDIAVHEALTQFMNVLSRRIKVEKSHFEPLVRAAVAQAIRVACFPVEFYQEEVKKAPAGKINEYLKENKKYYKWNEKAVTFLIDKAGFGLDREAYLKAIAANFQVIQDSLESKNLLLATLGEIKPFDLDQYIVADESFVDQAEEETVNSDSGSSFFESMESEEESKPVEKVETIQKVAEPVKKQPAQAPMNSNGGSLVASSLKAHFSAESYKGMKGIMGELSESLALNQRFMFTKELFDGNADLLKHALKTIDEESSFEAAVELINARYVSELDWDTNSEAVREFLQLVYRKFAD
ncbi:hypothetical protein [Algoriphagus mannitolivorans]|uniref:hypothetical protein n=1 Tax=Algoriphagus mannitolivorans TaxID=226504 RepID=UPI00047BDB3B|nr:hypothetical protein [Algoriphagus mannitolivorans]